MNIKNQTDFGLGEVDESLLSATDQRQYSRALSKLDNMFVSSYRNLQKRPGSVLRNAFEPFAFPFNDFKRVSVCNSDNIWLRIYVAAEGTTVQILIVKWVPPFQTKTIAYDAGVNLDTESLSIDANEKFLVVAHRNMPPIECNLNFDDVTQTQPPNPINFSVEPSIDDGAIDYAKVNFTISGNPLGSIITHDGTISFSTDYKGGLMISENGASSEQPLGTALIDSYDSNTKQFKTIVTTPFSDKALTTGGGSWSIRRPVWSANTGYPHLCAWHDSRLWLVGTKEYPSLICGSRLNTYNDFNVRSGNDVDAISELLSEPKGGRFVHLFGGINLNLWTQDTQYIAWSGLDVGLTPKNFAPRPVSNYSVSTCEPIRYKNNVYFTTSNGKTLLEMKESYQQAEIGEVSVLAKHFINFPKFLTTAIIPSSRDQFLYGFNQDDTSFCYSQVSESNVSAFSSNTFALPIGCKIVDLVKVENKTFIIANANINDMYIYELVSDFFLDFAQEITLTNGEATLSDVYKNDTELSVISKDLKSYYGKFSVAYDNNKTSIQADLPDGDYYAGKIHTCTIKTMNNISSPENAFFKNKIVRNGLSYYNSYDIKINGKPTALSTIAEIQTEGVKLQTGIADIGNTQKTGSEHFTVVEQASPFDMNIQAIGYIVDKKAVL